MEESGSDSITTDAAIQRKHAAMLERLADRHQSRLARKPESDAAPTFESTRSFLTRFSNSRLDIESRLSQIRQAPDPTLKPELESISAAISDLEKLVAENSYFLPSYEVRTCLKAISDIKQSLDEVNSLVIPKKKFSFRNKKGTSNSTPVNDSVKESKTEKSDFGKENVGLKNLIVSPGFRGNENEVLVKEFGQGEAAGQNGEFTLSGLRNCEVRLKGCLRALFMDKLINCKVYAGAVIGSVLIEGAEGCVFVLASHQIRIHNAKHCDFYLRVRSRPIIEDSSGVRFAPYCLSYVGIEKDLDKANLSEEMGNWANVDDFRWLRAVQSPNWSVLPEEERIGTVNI